MIASARRTKSRWLMFAVTGGVLAVGGCTTPWTPRPTLPDRYTAARQQLMIHSDFPLPEHHRLLDELIAQRADLCRRLALPASAEPIHVYLFQSTELFQGFMRTHHPGFPNRRAFFVETDTRLSVYAPWGDRVGEDLRHEVTHAYLHAVVRSLPLWLDEGLAEYWEVPRGRRGLNRSHVDWLSARLQRRDWHPDLRRLEGLGPTCDISEDDYAESWAWVHFLLESRPELGDLLRTYLADLCRDGQADPLVLRMQRVLDQPERALIEHVGRLVAVAGQ